MVNQSASLSVSAASFYGTDCRIILDEIVFESSEMSRSEKAFFDSPTRTTNMKIVLRQLIPPSAFPRLLRFPSTQRENRETNDEAQTLSSTHTLIIYHLLLIVSRLRKIHNIDNKLFLLLLLLVY